LTNPSNGNLVQNADGTLTYTANLNFCGTDSFTYTIKDSSNAVSNAATVNLTIDPLNLEGGSGNDTLIGTACNNIINGNAGNDLIEGRADNDTLDGGAGFNDRLFGHGDNDIITDPDGVGTANGGTGTDTITVTFAPTWDNDTNPNNAPRSDGKIIGDYGNDLITLTMNKSNFFLNLKGDEPVSNTPQDGNDVVTLLGSYGNSVVDLGGGNDTFNGGVGSDNISGGNGNDLLLGSNGNDLLAGGAGADFLTGGNGADTFRYSSLSDSLLSGFDQITDLVLGTDKIDGPKAVSAANLAELGAVDSLTQADISAVLTSSSFVANGAATFTFGSQRFVALNDTAAGFSPTTDAILEITGFSGNINSLAII
jgi:Ca2+-binding RTX toxin-like protein